MNESSRELSPRHVLYLLVGGAVLAFMAVLVAASGLIVPTWGVYVLLVAWLAAVGMALRSWRTKMFGPLLWAVALAVFWVVFVLVGDTVLGWSA